MDELNLIELIKNMDKKLEEKYFNIDNLSKNNLRQLIQKNIGPIISFDKMSTKALKTITDRGGIFAVDGSSNTYGGNFPHYMDLYQATCLKSIKKEENTILVDGYIPLLDEEIDPLIDKDDKNLREKKLADLEVLAAIEGINKSVPKILLMDGSLIRYEILAKNNWDKLKDICLERNIMIAGIIEDIKTSIIYTLLKESNEINFETIFYDREILFNLLDYGEAIIIEDLNRGKSKYGLNSSFIRSSKSPTVIGVDVLEEQYKNLGDMISLILSITDENSRGIPLLMDLVDEQTRISDSMIKELLKTHMDVKFYEKLFNAQRYKRGF